MLPYDSTAQKQFAYVLLDGNLNKRVFIFVAMTVASTSVTQGTIVQDDSSGTVLQIFKKCIYTRN